MSDYKKKTETLLVDASKNLAQFVASSSYAFWERKDFRLYTAFANVPQSEQDRLFNELQVSVLGLFILHLDYARSVAAQKEKKDILKIIQKEIKKSFLAMFTDLGIDETFVIQWDKLIEMRLEEYRADLKTALKETEGTGEFQDSEELWNTWAIIETITIDSLSHIRRGTIEENDPLLKLLRTWFITLDTKLNPIIKMTREK
jgi:hypothetical protein